MLFLSKEDIEIRKQAENYQISEMDWGEYQYQAKEGFKGLEIVEIVLTGSSGDDNFHRLSKMDIRNRSEIK